MNPVFAAPVKWLLRQALALLLILAVLLVGAWIGGELKKNAQLADERIGLLAIRDARARARDVFTREIAQRLKKAESTLRIRQTILDQDLAERERLWDANVWTRSIPLSEAWQSIRILDTRITFGREALEAAQRLTASTRAQWDTGTTQAGLEIEALGRKIEDSDRAIAKGYVGRVQVLAWQELPLAASILIGILLIPIGIKLILYFLVAPWVTRRAPICLLPASTGRTFSSSAPGPDGTDPARMSAVSLPIVLRPNHELLIQPEYLQSTSRQAGKRTQWLLNRAIPLTSLLSGLIMLTRVDAAGSEPVVLSPTRDALSEVGILDLAEGAAFVCQPRSLAGVVQDTDRPLRITRHWRLGHLQSWLTLQLRFLVFHGPCQLVMKGCRGIRIETPGRGRLINQAATLGFSANLEVANIRCETFMSYWTGREDLFNDLFTGESGVYVYEEMPDLKRRTGITGRGLEGFSDAVLKLFGV